MARKSINGDRRRLNDPPTLILTSLAGCQTRTCPLEGHRGVRRGRLGPGALYGAISRLEERGLIEPLASEDRRRPYRITPEGSAYLSEAVIEMKRLADEGARRLAVAYEVPGFVSSPRIAGSPG